MAHGLDGIDWQAPWLLPWRARGEALAAQVCAGHSVAAVLNGEKGIGAQGTGAPHFVPQAALPDGVAYEAFIYSGQGVPTRDGLHDFFNGLVWMHFPLTKARLNALHMGQIERVGIQPSRGPVRDALTLMDENGALLMAPDALWEALWRKDWARLFGELRPLWAQAQLILFGHALMEKLVRPRKAITAHVYRIKILSVKTSNADWPDIDHWLASELDARVIQAKPFAPLPVLGVPGWWPANESPGFYADPDVFRSPEGAQTRPTASATRMPSTPADMMPPA